MIIVKLMGGLGNQMFQYAFGKSLALRLGTELKLDLSFLEACHRGSTPRNYELNCFNVTAPIATVGDIDALLGGTPTFYTIYAKLRKCLGLRWELPHFYQEPHYHYDKCVESLPDNTYLSGFWQSEHYFAAITNLLIKDFTWREPLMGLNQEVADMIMKTESVSIHVRRGDYVTDLETNQYHGVCGLDYYKAAVAKIVQCIGAPHFFVFSDDQVWAKEHLQLEVPHMFVDCNGYDKGYEDLRLMSLCQHNVLANSSFSWWAAWLNREPNKIVISPRRWFNHSVVDTCDLIPSGWLRL